MKESSGGEHPAAFLHAGVLSSPAVAITCCCQRLDSALSACDSFLLAGVLVMRMAYRGDSHPAKRAMHAEQKFFCVR